MKKLISLLILLGFFAAFTKAEAVTPNDQYYSNQWYLPKIKAEAAWNKVSGSPHVTIAVIDSGIQIEHPDLRGNIWHNSKEIPDNGLDDDNNGFIDDYSGWDFVKNTNDPSPKFSAWSTESGLSHGTVISGIIGASGNNNLGVTGLSWSAMIMPLRALDDKGEGRISDVIRAIDYAINNQADIINLSIVGFSYSQGLQEALERARAAGVIVVAAAGNDLGQGDGYDTDKISLYPACSQDKDGNSLVVGVAATDALDQKANFSSHGRHCISISAPGVSFFGLNPYNPSFSIPGFESYFNGYWSGTSMATPLVSSVLALVKEANPSLSSKEVINILLNSADNIDANNPSYIGQLGSGRLNVEKAVNWAKEKLWDYSGRLLIAPYGYQDKLDKDDNWNKVKLITNKNADVSSFSIGNEYKGGVSLAGGDVDGNGQAEIITAPLSGTEPLIKVFTSKGKLKNQFLAYDKKFKGGVSLATGDIDSDGQAEIIAAPLSGAEPMVKIFTSKGKLKNQFLAYDKKFKGGVNLASGDVDGDGQAEIVTGTGVGGGPHVRIFDAKGKLKGQFFAYDKNFKGGVRLAVVNLDGRRDRNESQIITAPGEGLEPTIKVFDRRGNLKRKFQAFSNNFRGGVLIAGGDLNHDGISEIAVAAGPGGAPHVRIFDRIGGLQESFYTFKDSFTGGVSLGFIFVSN